jgi:hypothetical protein
MKIEQLTVIFLYPPKDKKAEIIAYFRQQEPELACNEAEELVGYLCDGVVKEFQIQPPTDMIIPFADAMKDFGAEVYLEVQEESEPFPF